MDNLKNMQEEKQTTKEEYNKVPVIFCKHCLSLAIRNADGIDYCDECGSTEMIETSIDNWEKVYILKYDTTLITDGKEKPYKNYWYAE